MYHMVKNPPQWLLDGLMSEHEATKDKKCHDCAVKPGQKHSEGCDVARCHSCGGQRLSCDCENPGEDVWTGIWPGIKECYEQRLVSFNTSTGTLQFSLNALAEKRVGGSHG